LDLSDETINRFRRRMPSLDRTRQSNVDGSAIHHALHPSATRRKAIACVNVFAMRASLIFRSLRCQLR